MTPQRERLAIFEALVAWVRASALLQPLLFIVEDLHWADASTLELLGMLIEQAAESFYLWRGVRPRTAAVFELLRPSAR